MIVAPSAPGVNTRAEKKKLRIQREKRSDERAFRERGFRGKYRVLKGMDSAERGAISDLKKKKAMQARLEGERFSVAVLTKKSELEPGRAQTAHDYQLKRAYPTERHISKAQRKFEREMRDQSSETVTHIIHAFRTRGRVPSMTVEEFDALPSSSSQTRWMQRIRPLLRPKEDVSVKKVHTKKDYRTIDLIVKRFFREGVHPRQSIDELLAMPCLKSLEKKRDRMIDLIRSGIEPNPGWDVSQQHGTHVGLLLREGIEPNPGFDDASSSSSAGSSFAAKRIAARRDKKQCFMCGSFNHIAKFCPSIPEHKGDGVREGKKMKHKMDKATASLVEGVARSVAAEKGAADAQKEKDEEKRSADAELAEEAAKAAEIQRKAAFVSRVQKFLDSHESMKDFWTTHRTRDSERFIVGSVANDRSELAQILVPHSEWHYQLRPETENLWSDQRHPGVKDVKCYDGDSSHLIYSVQKINCGLMGVELSKEAPFMVAVSLDLLLLADQRGFVGVRAIYEVIEAKVEAWIANHLGVNLDYLSPARASYADLVNAVTALLILLRSYSYQPDLTEVLSSDFCNLIQRQYFRILAKDGAAPGRYVRGYHVTFWDVFAGEVPEVQGGISTSEQHEDVTLMKSWRYCRSLPHSITNVLPTFPDPFESKNIVVGAVKRLLLKPLEIAKGVPELIDALYLKLAQSIGSCEASTRAACEYLLHWREHGGGAGWTVDQREMFARGLNDYCLVRDGADGVMQRVRGYCESFNSMVKKELYDSTKIKAPRFITIPCFELRGFTYGLLHDAELRIEKSDFGQFLVKGLRAEEIKKKFVEAVRECEAWIETDFTSMESNVRGRFLKAENMFFQSILGPMGAVWKQVTDWIYYPFLTMQNKFYRILTHALRLSGSYWTSIGNGTANIVYNAGILLVASCGTIDAALEFANRADVTFRRICERIGIWGHSLFEGDDGIFRLPLALQDVDLSEIAMACGFRLKLSVQYSIEKLHFCGNYLSAAYHTSLGWVREVMKDPLDVIAKLTHVFDAYMTDKDDRCYETARCLSQMMVTPSLPVVSEWCRGILNKNFALIPGMIKKLRDPDYRATWKKEWVDRARSMGVTLDEYIGLLPSRDFVPKIPEEVYHSVADMYGFSVNQLRLWEREIATYFRDGLDSLILSTAPIRAAYHRVETRVRQDLRVVSREVGQNVGEAWITVKLFAKLSQWIFVVALFGAFLMFGFLTVGMVFWLLTGTVLGMGIRCGIVCLLILLLSWLISKHILLRTMIMVAIAVVIHQTCKSCFPALYRARDQQAGGRGGA
jgi:hypothetical protein